MAEMSDLRAYIRELDKLKLLKTIQGADWNLEIGALTDLNAKSRKYALLFDDIKGYPQGFRVFTGSLLDATRVALSLNIPDIRDNLSLVRAIKSRIGDIDSIRSKYEPVTVKSAPIFENTDKGEKIDLLKFPTPKWFINDGGRYIGTSDAVVTADPDTGWINVGTYRIMVKDKQHLTILMEASRHGRIHLEKYQAKGKELPLVVSFGHNPALNLFSALEVPEGVSEFAVLGAVRREPVPVVTGPVTGLPIPADSEIAIEGYVTSELSDEGPLGEFIGYYGGGKMQNPVVRIEAVYYRNSPIMLGTCAGIPPYDYSYFRCPVRSALIWNALEASGISGVNGVWCHEEGYSRAFNAVSIKQAYAGHAVMAGHIASQCRPGSVAGRYTIVVDEDIDPSKLNEVIWAMSSRSDPQTNIHIISGTMGTPLDPVAIHEPGKKIQEYTSSRGVIVAVKPFEKVMRGTFPGTVKSDADTERNVRKKYPEVLK